MPERETYSIDFSKPPVSIDEYDVGNRISRSQFLNLLIDSFAVSEGRYHMQMVFLDWVKAHNGLNWRESLAGFISNGGWNSLTIQEQEEFSNKFDKVLAHKKEYETKDLSEYEAFHRDPRNIFDEQISAMVDDFGKDEDTFLNHAETNLFIKAYGDLSHMSKGTFLKNIKNFSSKYDESYED